MKQYPVTQAIPMTHENYAEMMRNSCRISDKSLHTMKLTIKPMNQEELREMNMHAHRDIDQSNLANYVSGYLGCYPTSHSAPLPLPVPTSDFNSLGAWGWFVVMILAVNFLFLLS